jgi:hypothetical protein
MASVPVSAVVLEWAQVEWAWVWEMESEQLLVLLWDLVLVQQWVLLLGSKLESGLEPML